MTQSNDITRHTNNDFIVFFDGYCGLCNKSVDWLLSQDRKGQIKFAPLQGDTAKLLLSESDRADLDTVIVWDRGGTFKRSEAIFKAIALVGPQWNLLVAVLNFIPVKIRDIVYRAVAANRYPVFGKRDTCRLPAQNEQQRFLP